MTDEPNDPRPDGDSRAQRRLLASAYLDGELTPEERWRAEADPLVLDEVDAMRDVRARLATVPPPDRDRREAAIAAALAMATTDVVAPARPATRTHRRTRWLAPLAAAAAVVVLVVGGIVALRRGDSDDDTATRTDEATTQLLDEASESGADDADQETAASTLAAGSGTTPPAAAAPAEAETSQAGAEGTAAAAGTTAVAAAEATTGAAGGGAAESAMPIVRTGDDLVALQEFFAVARENSDAAAPTSVAPQCAVGEFLTLAQYEPSPTLEPREVEVYVDATGAVIAVDAATCAEVLRATP
jgi:hypothetical protein